jgi:hypothetical protein
MKKLIALLFVSAGISFAAHAQDQNKSTSTEGADIQFETTVHDYGTMQQDANGDCEFKFKNTGTEPLVLSNVVASCGCTTPSWPKEPLMPGKSSVIKVHYDTKRIGIISKQITVMSNAKTDRVILNIKGNVLAKETEKVPEKTQSPTITPNK